MSKCADVRRLIKNDRRLKKRLYSMYLNMLVLNKECFGNENIDPIYCPSVVEFQKQLDLLNGISRNHIRQSKTFTISNVIRKAFMEGNQNEQFIMYYMLQHDEKNSKIHWDYCKECNGSRLKNPSSNDTQVCEICSKKVKSKDQMYPFWIDNDGTKRFDLPDELKDLTVGEKLLIQKRAVLLPIVHMQKNKVGLKGHAVVFEKNIDDVCSTLPRTKVEMVYVVREYTKSTSSQVTQANFNVRRSKVLGALYWLKRFHIGYKDINIDASNLDWMGENDECEISSDIVTNSRFEDYDTTSKKRKHNKEKQTTVSECQTDVETDQFHFYSETSNVVENIDEKGSRIIEELKLECSKAGKEFSSIQFPFVSNVPLNEYDTERLFADTYPWLFPGGVGDISAKNTSSSEDLASWSKILMRWKDGRFMRDDFFSFHIHNFITRRNNNSFSLKFRKHILSAPDITVEEIKNQIRNNDFSFIDKLIHFGGTKVKGSDGFWRNRKYELESWVTEMITSGNGPPTLFLTMSCAEYWWDDLALLLIERLKHSEDAEKAQKLKDDMKNIKLRAFFIDKYTAIVQEYFQMKVDNWMETVGKNVFGITAYYSRFEFAKGRGQIHVHILACSKDHLLILPFGEAWKESKKRGVEILSDLVRKRYQMTCEIPECDNCGEQCEWKSVLHGTFSGVNDLEHDKCDLVRSCHMHYCNDFCLRYRRNE